MCEDDRWTRKKLISNSKLIVDDDLLRRSIEGREYLLTTPD